jgi:HEAT repeat protein
MKQASRQERLLVAEGWCASPDPSVRLRGVELASRQGTGGAELIFAALTDVDSSVREAAIRAATRAVPPARLLDGVASEDDAVLRAAASEALRLMGPRARRALEKGLSSKDDDVVMFSLQIIGGAGLEECVPHVIERLAHPNTNVAQAAVDALAAIRTPAAVGPLVGMLTGDQWLRLAAVLALGRIGDPRAVVDLVPLIEDELVGSAAVEALGRIGDASAIEPLCRALAAEERTVERDTLLVALGRCLAASGARPPVGTALAPAEPYLLTAMRANDPDLREAANRVARAFAIASLAPELVAHVDDSPVAAETVEYLARLPEGSGIAAVLTRAAADERPGIRAAALRVLARRSEAWGDALLARALEDPEPSVVAGAVRGVATRMAPGAFTELLPLLFHSSEKVWSRAFEALRVVARPEDEARLKELVRSASGPELLAYVELSRRLDPARFADAWLARLDDAEPELLKLLLRALAAAPGAGVKERLVPYLEHPSATVRTLAIEALSHGTPAPGIAQELHRRLLSDRECSYYLVRALGRLKHTAAVEDLVTLFVPAPALEKVAILEALGAMETPRAGRFLEDELASRDRERRRAAAAALARHYREGRLQLFLRLAADEDWAVRNSAVLPLAELGGARAHGALKRLLEDPEEVVRRSAAAAMGARR